MADVRIIIRQDHPADVDYAVSAYTGWTESRHGFTCTVRTQYLAEDADSSTQAEAAREAAADLDDWFAPEHLEQIQEWRAKRAEAA